MTPIAPLPQEVLTIVRALNARFQDSREHRGRRAEHHVPNPNFKPTAQFINTEGIEASINEIRDRMNKITQITYDKLSGEIVKLLNELLNECTTINFDKLTDAFFKLVYENQMSVSIYAKLYKSFIGIDKINNGFMDKLREQLKKYEETIINLEVPSDECSYDEQCSIGATNDKLKGFSKFVVYIAINELIDKTYVINIINRVIAQMAASKDEISMSKQNEILADHIYILCVEDMNIIRELQCTESVIDAIDTISKIPRGTCEGITTRCKYKLMDMIDILTGKRKKPI